MIYSMGTDMHEIAISVLKASAHIVIGSLYPPQTKLSVRPFVCSHRVRAITS